MLRLFRFLLTGDWHLHAYEIIENVRIVTKKKKALGYIYTSRCNICGKLKNFKVEA